MLADALGLIDHGEFLGRKDYTGDGTRDVMLYSELETFLGRIHADTQNHIVDLKVNCIGQVSAHMRSPVLPPVILELMIKHRVPVICLHRNPVSQWVSGALAEASGVWNTVETPTHARPKVRIEPAQLHRFIADCAAENALLEKWCADLPVLHLHYEDIFEADPQPFEQVFRSVSELTGFPRAQGWQDVRPIFKKLAHKRMQDNIENYDEIAHLLSDPGTRKHR
jgi:hypothetical protein